MSKPIVLKIVTWALLIFSGLGVGYKINGGNKASESSIVESGRRSTMRNKPGHGSVGELGGKTINNAVDAFKISDNRHRRKALARYFESLSNEELSEEVDRLMDLSPAKKGVIAEILFTIWGEKDPLMALEGVKKTKQLGWGYQNFVLKSWAATAPDELAEYYGTAPKGVMLLSTDGVRKIIAQEWAIKDPRAALAWAESLPVRGESNPIESIFDQLASKSPLEAVGLLSDISDPIQRSYAINGLAREWASKDWEAARDWILSLPEDQQMKANVNAILGLSDHDFGASIEQIDALLDGDLYSETMTSIASTWLRDDPAPVAAWLCDRGTVAQERVMRDSIYRLMDEDDALAYDYTNQIKDEKLRDKVVSNYLARAHNMSSLEKIEFAATIKNPGSKAQRLSYDFSVWHKEEPAAALAYLDSMEIEDFVRDVITKRLK